MTNMMTRMAAILAAAMIGGAVTEAAQVEVLRDRVNLRARPKPESEVAGQVNTGVVLESRGTDGDWVQVAPPATIGLWVFAEFVKEGKVAPAKLNVRAGAGINYPTVGTMVKDEPVTVRNKLGEWLEIAPPTNAALWIAREFVKELADPIQSAPAPVEAAPVAPAPVAVAPVDAVPVAVAPVAPTNEPVSTLPAEPKVAPERVEAPVVAVPAPVLPPPTPVAPPPDLGEKGLVPLEGQGEVMEREGVLQRTWLLDFGRLSNYCLTDRERGRPVTVCYLRGNNAQLKQLEGRRMKVKGEGYWIKGGAKPVIVPRQIMPLADPLP